jgi:uncharacterized protein
MPSPSVAASPVAVSSAPWWKFGHVWLVISGPAIVVVAGFATLWLAIARPDPVVAEDYYRQCMSCGSTKAKTSISSTPAIRKAGQAIHIKRCSLMGLSPCYGFAFHRLTSLGSLAVLQHCLRLPA